MTALQQLLRDVEQFLAETGMHATTFGLKALNDLAFVSNLRDGRKVRLDTAEKVRKFMADYRKKKATAELAA
jgi:predicted transcriptional regulator